MKIELRYDPSSKSFFIKRKYFVEGSISKIREYLSIEGEWLIRKSKIGFGEVPKELILFNSQRYALSIFKKLQMGEAIFISKYVKNKFK